MQKWYSTQKGIWQAKSTTSKQSFFLLLLLFLTHTLIWYDSGKLLQYYVLILIEQHIIKFHASQLKYMQRVCQL